MNQATSSTATTNIETTIKATDAIALPSLRQLTPLLWSMQQQGHEEQQVLQQEG
jgi:hypothetical protein